MPVIEVSDLALVNSVKDYLAGTTITATQIVRAAILLLHQSKLTPEQFFSLVGQTTTEEALFDAMGGKS